jgi:hypothetical protein
LKMSGGRCHQSRSHLRRLSLSVISAACLMRSLAGTRCSWNAWRARVTSGPWPGLKKKKKNLYCHLAVVECHHLSLLIPLHHSEEIVESGRLLRMSLQVGGPLPLSQISWVEPSAWRLREVNSKWPGGRIHHLLLLILFLSTGQNLLLLSTHL